MDQKKVSIAFIITFPFIVTYFHHWILKELPFHTVLEELYYIPLFFGALFFGLKGALFTYLYVSALYLPYFFGLWTVNFLDIIDRILHLLLTGAFAFLTGFLMDRQKKYQKQQEKNRYLTGLGEAVSTIVHDLKNPLINIMGFAKRLQQGKGNQGTALQTIIDSASKMEKIVQDVLDFAKPIPQDLREVDLKRIIQQAVESCKTKSEEAGIDLSTELPLDSLIVPADDIRMHRALTNIINNAIEASLKGQKVKIAVRKESDKIIIRIKDQGFGMDEETMENVFIPFYSKKGYGTGLGMAITKKVIDEHKGKIHIESNPGKGTKIIIELQLGISGRTYISPLRDCTDSSAR